MYNTEYRKSVGYAGLSQADADEKDEGSTQKEEFSDGSDRLSEEDLVEMLEFADVSSVHFNFKLHCINDDITLFLIV